MNLQQKVTVAVMWITTILLITKLTGLAALTWLMVFSPLVASFLYNLVVFSILLLFMFINIVYAAFNKLKNK